MKIKTATEQTRGPEVLRAAGHQVIRDEFCGDVTLLPNRTVLAKGFVRNTGHVHSQFEEIYLVLAGTLKLALEHGTGGRIEEIPLQPYDAVRIPPGIGHKVVGGSPDNAVMVSCDPAFVPGDEQRSEALESHYSPPLDGSNLGGGLNVSLPACGGVGTEARGRHHQTVQAVPRILTRIFR